MTAPTTAPATPNGISFADMLAIADTLGKQAALGVDVQIKMDLKVLETAFHGGLDLVASKHAADVDDATKLSEAYWKARNGNAIFDAKANNQRKLVSNMRKAIKLGLWSKGGPGEPLSTVNNLMSHRQKMRQNPALSKKLDDAHNTFMRFATAQLKSDTVLPDSLFESFCLRPVKDDGTLEELYEGVRKKFQKLKDGKIRHLSDSGPAADAIIQACTTKLKAIAIARGGKTTP